MRGTMRTLSRKLFPKPKDLSLIDHTSLFCKTVDRLGRLNQQTDLFEIRQCPADSIFQNRFIFVWIRSRDLLRRKTTALDDLFDNATPFRFAAQLPDSLESWPHKLMVFR